MYAYLYHRGPLKVVAAAKIMIILNVEIKNVSIIKMQSQMIKVTSKGPSSRVSKN